LALFSIKESSLLLILNLSSFSGFVRAKEVVLLSCGCSDLRRAAMRAVLGSVPGEGLGIGDLARVGKEELSFCTPSLLPWVGALP